ncbi:hypothetical protein FSP39_020641, partial [Pinctada imbricata]
HCRSLYNTFKAVFTITEHKSEVVIPDTFAKKVRKWLGNNEALFRSVSTQTILFIFNEYTREENVFNPLRDKRPMSVPEKPERQYIDELAEETSKTCDFCKYKLIQKAYNKNPIYKYPMFIWDLLPHAGASQVHPHVHAFLDTKRYQGAIENWRIASNLYNKDFPNRNYFSDLVSIHSALGLAVQYKSAVAFASLVPKKDNEVVVMCETPNDDFFTLMYFVYRAFLDDMEKLCYSSGIAFPSLDDNDVRGRLPAYARIITRGAVADIRSDISSLELFTSPNANTDPYKVIHYIKQSINKRSGAL